jgi:hypothetical protein
VAAHHHHHLHSTLLMSFQMSLQVISPSLATHPSLSSIVVYFLVHHLQAPPWPNPSSLAAPYPLFPLPLGHHRNPFLILSITILQHQNP